MGAAAPVGPGRLPGMSQHPSRLPSASERSLRKVPGLRLCPHSLCHFFSGNFQVKMSFLSPRLSASLLRSFSPTRWSAEIHVGDLPPHPEQRMSRGRRREGPQLPAAGAGRVGRRQGQERGQRGRGLALCRSPDCEPPWSQELCGSSGRPAPSDPLPPAPRPCRPTS